MFREINLRLPLQQADSLTEQMRAAARMLRIHPKRICGLRIIKESTDARQRVIYKQLRCLIAVDEPLPPPPPLPERPPKLPAGAARILIIGAGPAGLFAALRCLELGACPVILERGKDVSSRRFDLRPINCDGIVPTNSNYCFGEGGAGAFSDGKLYTRTTKRGDVSEIYRYFVAHGADPAILIESHPHIGSDKLPRIIRSIRSTILQCGGEVHFNTRVCGLLRSADRRHLLGVYSDDGREWQAAGVILATGHSARDVYRMLASEHLLMERKVFAAGVRIEHPQSLIDAAQYHLRSGQARPNSLPAARYALATTIRDRGVHSFCMCPGGFIVPAATENDEVVVNGMSLSRRNSPYANSGFVVTVTPKDTDSLNPQYGVLSGIAWQKKLEQATAIAGGGRMKAPAQRVPDFLMRRESTSLRLGNYRPGLTPYNLWELLPRGICERMAEALRLFEHHIPGFTSGDALLIGSETRTSSPVRIPRESDSLQHPELSGLFPCAEGAGYAGGIISAALDGRLCAEAAVASIHH